MPPVDFRLADVVQLRKPHPCGGDEWTWTGWAPTLACAAGRADGAYCSPAASWSDA